MTRNCDRCGAHMAPGSPRRRVGDQMLCVACVLKPRGGYVSAALSFEEHLLAMKKEARECGACDGTGDFDGVECGACEGTGDLTHLDELEHQDDGVHHFTHDEPVEHIMWNAVAAHDHLKDAHGLSDKEIDRRYETKKGDSTFWQGYRGAHDDVHAEHVRQKIPHQHGTATGPDSMRSSGSKVSSMQKHAHDSGDGETIYHCPFCGSGQVIARSDRTIECEFCHTCFTVQVQPEFSAFPQTINGMPVQVPGMPGQMGVDPMAGGGVDPATGMPMDPNAAGAPAAGGAPEDGGGFPPTAAEDGGDPAEEEGDSEKDEKKKDNPFTSGLRGTTSQIMATEDYLAHLALVHSGDRNRTLAMIHKRRNRRG